MNFLRHLGIYHFDEGAISFDRAIPHRNDELPDRNFSAGCFAALPASASASGACLAPKGF
jgi:hypothetical protein